MTLRTRAALFLAFVAVAAVVLAVQASGGVRLQTNLIAMLPQTERDPLAEQVLGKLAAKLAGRVTFLVSASDATRARRAAEIFAAALEKGGGMRYVVAQLGGIDRTLPAQLYGAHRFGLLTDEDRANLAAGAFELRDAALRELVLPMKSAAVLAPEQDPFGFFARWLAQREPRAGRLRLENGFLAVRDGERLRLLVLGELDGDPYDERVQERVISGYERAAAELRAADPQAELWRAGTVFYAAAARQAAKRDMERISVGATIGIALLMLAAFRSLRPILLGLISAGIGILVGTACVVLLDGELHLISLGFGASLIGEAVDYAILLFAAHLAAGVTWTPQQGIAQIAPGLTVAVGTSLLAYALLSLLPFPGVSQIARLALIGLAASYLAVLCLLPAFMRRPSARDPLAATAWAARLLERWSALLHGRRAMGLAVVLIVACVPGWLALHANDDVRLLIARDAELSAQESAIRALTGLDAGGRFFLVRGSTDEEVLRREGVLVERLRGLEKAGALTRHQAVSDFVPAEARQDEDRALVAKRVFGNPAALTSALAQVGFRREGTERLLQDFDRGTRPVTVADWLASPLSAPLRHLWRPAGPAPASVVTLQGERDSARVAQATAGLPGVTLVDKAASVSSLLGWYRAHALPALLIAAMAVLLVLVLRYGVRQAPRVMLPVVLAEGISAAIFGYSGEPVTVLTVGGWLLTLGIGVNYAIFLREGEARRGATTMAVLLSGSTTLLAWGLLALSSMPALRQFGLALATGIACSVAFTPLALRRT